MRKKIIVSFVILLVVSLIMPMFSQAAYQVRPNFNALVNTTAPDFFYNIRLMETSEGPMGLNMSKDNIYTGGDGNNIDVHMMKNTEWGAAAMLSLSGYGAGSQANVNSSGYSSGNYTGIYGMSNGNWEYMATLVSEDNKTIATNDNSYARALADKGIGINSKYFDVYDTKNLKSYNQYDAFYARNYKNATEYAGTKDFHGDAIYETINLYMSANPSGIRNHVFSSNPFFVRGFSYGGGVLASGNSYGYAYSNYTSRAVVVCASGLL